MTEQESAVNLRRLRGRRRSQWIDAQPPGWPGYPEHVEAGTIDFEAIAHVLANTCRWGGRTRRFFSLAQYALVMLEEAEALEGIAGEGRRALALHALLTNARTAWVRDETGDLPASARAAVRAGAHGAAIDTAVREAAGLDLELPEEWSEALRFVARMTDAAERRDLGVGAGGFPFPALRRTVRPLAPEAAAERRLARFRELAGSSPADTGSVRAGSSGSGTAPASVAAEASS